MRDEPRYAGFLRFLGWMFVLITVTHWPFLADLYGWIDLPDAVMRVIDVELMR